MLCMLRSGGHTAWGLSPLLSWWPGSLCVPKIWLPRLERFKGHSWLWYWDCQGWWELGGSELGCRVAGGDAAVPWLHPGLSGLLSGAGCLHQPGITVPGCSVPLWRGDAACLGLGRGAACVGALGQHPAERIGLGQLHPAREREGEGQKGWEPVCSQERKCQGWAAGWIRASSGRRAGREREGGSVVHLSFTRGLSTSIQLETCRAMRPDPEILTASAHPPMAVVHLPHPPRSPPQCRVVLWGQLSLAERRWPTVWAAPALASHGGELPGTMSGTGNGGDIW